MIRRVYEKGTGVYTLGGWVARRQRKASFGGRGQRAGLKGHKM